MAEITFLAPGSCQLEVTAQGNVGTDTGVDLASVSWTIEQALIAGCRFSPSAGDVHIDRNGVLTIGRSLFDRINQADGDDAIPGQCTLVIRADSTITKTVLDRFKVLVGYPGEGGGGGGGSQTVELKIMEVADSPLSTAYFTVEDSSGTQLTITPVTEGDFHYFTITANVGELLTFKTIEGSGYVFASDTKYVMNEDHSSQNTYPLAYSMEQVQIVAADDPNAVNPYLMLAISAV